MAFQRARLFYRISIGSESDGNAPTTTRLDAVAYEKAPDCAGAFLSLERRVSYTRSSRR